MKSNSRKHSLKTPCHIGAPCVAISLALIANVFLIGEASAESGWLIKQVHRTYGTMDVYLRSKGIKINCIKSRITFTCNAPDWTMILYNHPRKAVCKKKFDEWSKVGIRTSLQIQNNDGLWDWPRVIVARKKFFGLNSVVWAFPGRLENGRPANLKYGKFAEYVLTDALKTDRRVETFMQMVEDVPPDKGIPLSFWTIAKSNSYGMGLKYNLAEERFSTVETKSIKRVENIATAPDTIVSSYKVCPENDVVVDQKEFSDVFRNLMTDEPNITDSGKQKKRSGTSK